MGLVGALSVRVVLPPGLLSVEVVVEDSEVFSETWGAAGVAAWMLTHGRLGIALTIFKVRRTKPVNWLTSNSVASPVGSPLQR
jgi:hypothetical protein